MAGDFPPPRQPAPSNLRPGMYYVFPGARC